MGCKSPTANGCRNAEHRPECAIAVKNSAVLSVRRRGEGEEAESEYLHRRKDCFVKSRAKRV